MRVTKYPLFTIKEKPKNTKLKSTEYMLRAGIIQQNSSGLYTWLPLGYKILNKIKKIIRYYMQKIGGIEIYIPILQSAKLWKKSGRWKLFGKELFKLNDRKKKKFILSPTNEEVITKIIKKNKKILKNLPILFFQIQNKFRDEIRPSYGVIRSKEFIMKDAYSFHKNKNSLKKTYKIISKIYTKIFKKMNLKFKIIKTDGGVIGDGISHEFVTIKKKKKIKKIIKIWKKQKIKKIKLIYTKKKPLNIIKTLLIKTNKNNKKKFFILLFKKNKKLNLNTIKKIKNIYKPINYANSNDILKIIGKKTNNIGPIGLNYPIIADISVINMKNFTIGANNKNKYYKNVNWLKNLPKPYIINIKNKIKHKKNIIKKKKIEIGHIFQLGIKYSKIMNIYIKNLNKKKKYIHMGCYGIGITRLIAAIIEQNNDNKGIIWPNSIAPFSVSIIPIQINKNKKVKLISEKIYKQFKNKNIDIIFYDKIERTGVIFAEIELIGIPHNIIISKKYIKNKKIEYQNRKTKEKKIIKIKKITEYICKLLKKKK